VPAIIEQLVNELRTMPFTLLTVLSLVLFAVYSNNNFASASEIKELSQKVSENSDIIEQVLQLQIAESLRNLQLQKCQTEDTVAERTLSRTIEDLQASYRRLTGSRYPLRECST